MSICCNAYWHNLCMCPSVCVCGCVCLARAYMTGKNVRNKNLLLIRWRTNYKKITFGSNYWIYACRRSSGHCAIFAFDHKTIVYCRIFIMQTEMLINLFLWTNLSVNDFQSYQKWKLNGQYRFLDKAMATSLTCDSAVYGFIKWNTNGHVRI